METNDTPNFEQDPTSVQPSPTEEETTVADHAGEEATPAPSDAVAPEPAADAPEAQMPTADTPDPGSAEADLAEQQETEAVDDPQPSAEEDTEQAADPESQPEPEESREEQPSAEAEPERTLDEQPAADADAAAEPEPSPELVAAVEEAFEGAPTDEAEAPEVVDWVPGDWYVVHTYAGYENKVKADLESRVASMNMEESIYEVVIPMEEVMEIKSGKKQMVPRKVFPGYLLVRMDLNDDSWYVVRNTPGVTGFVGSGNKPIPLSEKEVDKILRRKEEPEKPKTVAEWQVNDPVRVTTGPFANFQGSISDVDGERQKVKVLVNIFGRETPVELSFDQIAKV